MDDLDRRFRACCYIEFDWKVNAYIEHWKGIFIKVGATGRTTDRTAKGMMASERFPEREI